MTKYSTRSDKISSKKINLMHAMTKYSTRSDKISSNKLHRRPPITVAVSVDTLLAFSSQPVSLYILHTINLNLSFDIPSFDSQPSSQGDHV
jgi:hypothetical protein